MVTNKGIMIGFVKNSPLLYKIFISLFILFLFILSGCSAVQNFQIKSIAKTDIDDVTEIHIAQVNNLLKELTIKLYKKNPNELKKIEGSTIDSRLDDIFTCPSEINYEELDSREAVDSILLGFEPDFQGDRVFAVMYGLYTMIHKSYNSKCELFMLDYLDAQKLYNTARNIEIFVWRLKTRKQHDGSLFLLTNNLKGVVINLSYERIFGKLISLQDTMSQIVSGRNNRLIKEVIQIVGMSFLPI